MKYTKQMRQKLLSRFLCPFTCDFNQPNNDCPFWHRAPPEESHWHPKHAECIYECPPNIKPLPVYCCASFLALKCSKREYSFQCGAHSSAEILTRCEDGFHMELGEVDDLQLFAQKMAKVLLEASEYRRSEFKSIENVPGSVRNRMDVLMPLPSNYISAGQKRPRDVLFKDDENEDENDNSCAICLDQLTNHQIGHLDNCSHVFCAKCIHKWQNHGVNEGCPVCRKKISKILVWPKLLQTQEEKQQLFDLIRGGVPSDERVDRAMAKGIRAYFKTFDGKTINALHMKPESMKVFLKKPKLNWYCYIMTEMAVEREPNLNPIPVVTPSQTSDIPPMLSNTRGTIHPSFIHHSYINRQPPIMNNINPNPINRTSNSNVEHIFASTNSSATNNAATNYTVTNNDRFVTICCNPAAIRNARMNNRETNRSNNGSAISNVAPNIDSTTNLTAATNPNSTNSPVSNHVATNATNNNQTSESNSSRVRNPNRNPVRSASDVAVQFGSNRDPGITVCGRPSIASESEHNSNPIPVVTLSEVSDVLRMLSNTRGTNHPSYISQRPSIMNPINSNPINRTANFNVAPNIASTNSTATRNAATSNPRICNNVAAIRNARMNNRETNRINNGSAISNVAPNIDSTTNLTAATNPNPTNSTARNNVATNATNNNQTSESNI